MLMLTLQLVEPQASYTHSWCFLDWKTHSSNKSLHATRLPSLSNAVRTGEKYLPGPAYTTPLTLQRYLCIAIQNTLVTLSLKQRKVPVPGLVCRVFARGSRAARFSGSRIVIHCSCWSRHCSYNKARRGQWWMSFVYCQWHLFYSSSHRIFACPQVRASYH